MALGQIHIGSSGPSPCHADPNNPLSTGCPFVDSPHFDSWEEATAYFDSVNDTFARPLRKNPSSLLDTPDGGVSFVLNDSNEAVACVASNCNHSKSVLHFPSTSMATTSIRIKAERDAILEREGVDLSKTVLDSPTGSLLYGLATPTSDHDSYVVTLGNQKSHQYIEGGVDVNVSSLSTFLRSCESGASNTLEVMFSPYTSGPLDNFRHSYRINTPGFANKYRRAIRDMVVLGTVDPKAQELMTGAGLRNRKSRRTDAWRQKSRRHALRMYLNMNEGIETGRFNPVLSEWQKDFVLTAQDWPDLKVARYLSKIL